MISHMSNVTTGNCISLKRDDSFFMFVLSTTCLKKNTVVFAVYSITETKMVWDYLKFHPV